MATKGETTLAADVETVVGGEPSAVELVVIDTEVAIDRKVTTREASDSDIFIYALGLSEGVAGAEAPAAADLPLAVLAHGVGG